ncbi:MAG: hypothetical protein EHM24_09010 [Acidobacteria bacterium]|nr:MAG: hypothetical protein EHM24_09010 [Acidobacteriota bacterium]
MDAYPTEEFTGTVVQVRLQPIVVQNVVTYGTVIEVPNPSYKLKPGMTANVNIEIAKRTNVLRVPNAAVRFRPTEEIFTALKQEIPPEMQRGARMAGGMAGRGRGDQGQGGATAGQPQGAGANAQGAGANARAAGQAPAAQAPGGQRQAANAPAANAQQAPPAGQRPGQGGGFERGGGDRPQGEARGDGLRGQGGQGEGRGFGMGPGGDPTDPERRARFEERLKQMTPEQREQFMARMKERGGSMGAPAAGRGPNPGAGRAASVPAMSTGSAATIDQLFGPLPTVITRGRAWLWLSGPKQVKSVPLRLGISDGQYTELLEGELQPGQELVTGILLGTEATNRAGQTASPLMQQRGGPPPGGFGGGRGR